MKKVIVVLLVIAAMAFNCRSVLAQDLDSGAKVFSANCAACHAGGRNVVNGAKTLKKDVLEKYDMYSVENIKQQIYNGKNAMPSFRGRLTDEQIADVSAYVLSQAEQGW